MEGSAELLLAILQRPQTPDELSLAELTNTITTLHDDLSVESVNHLFATKGQTHLRHVFQHYRSTYETDLVEDVKSSSKFEPGFIHAIGAITNRWQFLAERLVELLEKKENALVYTVLLSRCEFDLMTVKENVAPAHNIEQLLKKKLDSDVAKFLVFVWNGNYEFRGESPEEATPVDDNDDQDEESEGDEGEDESEDEGEGEDEEEKEEEKEAENDGQARQGKTNKEEPDGGTAVADDENNQAKESKK